MGLRINTNVIALRAQRNLGYSTKALSRAMERLSSGSRINSAGDDAAGLAVSEGLRSQVRGLSQAIRNANDGIGFLNTAEGALAESTNVAQRVRELAIQSANGAISNNDRSNLNAEVQSLIQEFDRIATSTEFNGVFLLDGTFQTTDLQVGTRRGQTISFSIGDARAASLGALAALSGVRGMISTAIGTMTINGVPIPATSASDDTLSSGNNSFSAIAIAKAINSASSQTNVYADLLPTIVQVNNMDFSGFASGDLSADNFKINDIPITGTGINSVNSFIIAVNAYSSQTGVRARLQSGSTNSIEFYANDGRNIEIFWSATVSTGLFNAFANSTNFVAFSSGSVFTYLLSATAGISVANASGIIRTGSVKLRSSSAITIGGTNTSSALGFSGTSIAVSNQTSFASITVANQSSAQDALAVVDVVLTQLVNIRASLGAVQNRLDITGSRLGITSENLNAAQSQIRDTDMAVESAELTKQQILQQAGVAILGQANVSAQAALRLLNFNG